MPDEKRWVVTAEKTQLKVCLDKQVIEKLDRIKALLSHKKSHLTDAELIETLADLALERLDPGLKRVREPKKAAAKKLSTSGAANKNPLSMSKVAAGQKLLPTLDPAVQKSLSRLPSETEPLPASVAAGMQSPPTSVAAMLDRQHTKTLATFPLF